MLPTGVILSDEKAGVLCAQRLFRIFFVKINSGGNL